VFPDRQAAAAADPAAAQDQPTSAADPGQRPLLTPRGSSHQTAIVASPQHLTK